MIDINMLLLVLLLFLSIFLWIYQNKKTINNATEIYYRKNKNWQIGSFKIRKNQIHQLDKIIKNKLSYIDIKNDLSIDILDIKVHEEKNNYLILVEFALIKTK